MFKGTHFIRGQQGPLAIGQADTLASPPLSLYTRDFTSYVYSADQLTAAIKNIQGF
jgi:hypothetical protein